MISTTTLTHAARVALQGYLTAVFFKEIVVDRTIQVVSRSEKVSIGLVTSTVRSSTAVLLLATAKAAQQFLSDDRPYVPAHKDVNDTAELHAPLAGDSIVDSTSTTKAFGASSSRAMTESTEPAFDGPAGGLSTIDSDTTLIACDEDLDKNVFDDDLVLDATDLGSLADESTFYEDDCQATTQRLADDEREHILHAASDSHTINNLIRRMAALSLDDVPSHISSYSLDNVSSHVSTISLDNVPSHISTISLADVPSQCDSHTIDNLIRSTAALSLDDVPSHISTMSLADIPSCLSPSLDNVSFDDVPSHLSTLSPDHVPSHFAPILSLNNVSFDDVPSNFSTLSLDHVSSHFTSTFSLDNVSFDDAPSHFSTLSLDHVLSHFTPILSLDNVSFDDVPSHFPTISLDNVSLDNVPSHLSTLSVDHVPSHFLTLWLDLDKNPPQSSKCQPRRAVVHDHTIDDLVSKMVALSLDNVSSQKHQSHLHDHAIDALLQNSEALALDDDNAIDALLQNSEALTLDDDYTIDAILQNSEALTLDKTPAINALSLDGNHAIDALLHNSEALTLDNNHAIQVDALLHKSDAHTHDNASQSSEPMLHDNSDDRSSHWHLRRNSTNTLLRNIEIIDPRNFNHDTPYTTMLSTPYFEIWNLLFLMITPHSR